MVYLFAKFVHVTAVGITFALFVLRGIWVLRDSPMLRRRWVRFAPHVNDTALLAAALVLASAHGLQPWIAAKVAGLGLYIGLGMLALRWARHTRTRVVAWVAAELVFVYIIAVAITRDPRVGLV